MIAQKARKILKDNNKLNAKQLVKLMCDNSIPAAKLGFCGITLPLHKHTDIKEEVIAGLEAEGFEIQRDYCDDPNWIMVKWSPK